MNGADPAMVGNDRRRSSARALGWALAWALPPDTDDAPHPRPAPVAEALGYRPSSALVISSTLHKGPHTGSMGRVGACGDNAAMESSFALLQKNVLPPHKRPDPLRPESQPNPGQSP